jgi:hypothetical protein
LQKIRLFGFSPEGVELKAERRKPSGEKHCEIEDNPSLTGVLAHFRFQRHCPHKPGSRSPGEIRLLGEENNAKAQGRKDAKVVDLP